MTCVADQNRGMRNITREKKIQANSLAEIRRGLRDEAERLADSGMKGDSKAAPAAYLLNWCVCWFLSLPAEERLRIAQEGKAILDGRRGSDKPVWFGSGGDPDWVGGSSAPGLPGYVSGPVAQERRKSKRANRAIRNKSH